MSDRKIAQIVRVWFGKVVQVIMQARSLPRPDAASRPDKWFNLEMQLYSYLEQEVEHWREQGEIVGRPLVLRVMKRQPEAEGGGVKLLEHWRLELTPPEPRARVSSSENVGAMYKRAIIMLRSLYMFVRVLPAYAVLQDERRRVWPVSGAGVDAGEEPPVLYHEVSSSSDAPDFTRTPHAEFKFSPVHTPLGALTLCVTYRQDCEVQAVESGPILTPKNIITDYISPDRARTPPGQRRATTSQPLRVPANANVHRRPASDTPNTGGTHTQGGGTPPSGASAAAARLAGRTRRERAVSDTVVPVSTRTTTNNNNNNANNHSALGSTSTNAMDPGTPGSTTSTPVRVAAVPHAGVSYSRASAAPIKIFSTPQRTGTGTDSAGGTPAGAMGDRPPSLPSNLGGLIYSSTPPFSSSPPTWQTAAGTPPLGTVGSADASGIAVGSAASSTSAAHAAGAGNTTTTVPALSSTPPFRTVGFGPASATSPGESQTSQTSSGRRNSFFVQPVGATPSPSQATGSGGIVKLNVTPFKDGVHVSALTSELNRMKVGSPPETAATTPGSLPTSTPLPLEMAAPTPSLLIEDDGFAFAMPDMEMDDSEEKQLGSFAKQCEEAPPLSFFMAQGNLAAPATTTSLQDRLVGYTATRDRLVAQRNANT